MTWNMAAQIAGAVAALLSGVFWLAAALPTIPGLNAAFDATPEPYFNSVGALCAGVAGLCQGVSLAITSRSRPASA